MSVETVPEPGLRRGHLILAHFALMDSPPQQGRARAPVAQRMATIMQPMQFLRARCGAYFLRREQFDLPRERRRCRAGG
jgi:hypothetical protein